MRFYRRLTAFKAISFDLDDTLYANGPNMVAAERKMLSYFKTHFSPLLANDKQTLLLDSDFWWPFRQQVIDKNAIVGHDVVALRLATYTLGALFLGFETEQARIKAQQAMDYFSIVRSEFVVPERIHLLLTSLSQYLPLVAITNGNVDVKAIGLAPYFSDVYYAVDGFKQKPSGDMFALACQRLTIRPDQLLHVGDCGRADILGAVAYGCQAAWLNSNGPGKPLSLLPHVVLDDITDISRLLG